MTHRSVGGVIASNEPCSLDAVLRRLVAGALWATGAQASVVVDGVVAKDIAAGERAPGQPLTRSAGFAHVCTFKPLIALAVLGLAERGLLDLQRPLASFSDRYPRLIEAEGVVADVLCHDAGLVEPHPLDVRLCPARERTERIAALFAQDCSRRASYSEHAAWRLLGDAIEDATGEPADRFIQRDLIDLLGIGEEVRVSFDEAWFTEHHDDLAPYWEGLGGTPVPLLHDLVSHVARDTCQPGFGGYASARGLAQLYEPVSALLSDRVDAVPGFPSAEALCAALDESRGHESDGVLDRPCDFAAGFMVGLGDHFFGTSPSEEAIGHGGWMGTSFVLIDPVHDLVAAVVLNGTVAAVEDLAHLRPPIIDAIYADVL